MAKTESDPDPAGDPDDDTPELPPIDHLTDAFQLKVAADGRNARLLAQLAKPRSAAEVGRLTGQPRQRVNYHLGLLRQADLVRPAGSRRRRGFTEKLYQATAAAYIVRPDALGPIAPPAEPAAPTESGADHVVHFESDDERAAFLRYVDAAIRQAAEHHASAADRPGARAYRVSIAATPASST